MSCMQDILFHKCNRQLNYTFYYNNTKSNYHERNCTLKYLYSIKNNTITKPKIENYAISFPLHVLLFFEMHKLG